MSESMRMALRRTWILMLAPGVALLFLTEVIRYGNLAPMLHISETSVLPSVLLFISAFVGIGLPLLYRAAFANAHKRRQSVPMYSLFRYENNSIVVALLAVWPSIVASICSFPRFHASAMFIIALYVSYTAYPSKRKLDMDERVFRATP